MSRDLRRYASQTNFQLWVGFILLLFLVGDGLVYWIYGRNAAILGAICLVAGLLPVGIIWIFLAVIDWVVRRYNQER